MAFSLDSWKILFPWGVPLGHEFWPEEHPTLIPQGLLWGLQLPHQNLQAPVDLPLYKMQ